MFKTELPDLIEVWPDEIDFPLHRKWLKENRDKFKDVIIVFSKCNWGGKPVTGDVMKELVIDAAPIHFVFSEAKSGEDWRNVAVNEGLKRANSEWVYFTEQDFFPKDKFWDEVKKAEEKGVEVISVNIDGRMHPCSLFVKRSLLDRTSLDFSANPPDYDHFGKIQKDIYQLSSPSKMYTISWFDYYHMNGLTHNMHLLTIGEDPVYKPEEFKDYLVRCLASGEWLSQEFKELAEYYIREY